MLECTLAENDTDKFNMKNNKKRTALYVCPAYDSRMVISFLLRSLDLDVVTTTYEGNMLEEFNTLPEIDIVVLDHLQSMEHLEWCSQLKSDARTENSPIIAVLANENISQDEIAKLKIDFYTRTPVDIDSFQKIITRYIDK